MRIAIIGYPGSGKRELTKYLERKYFCPCLYLDDIFVNDTPDEIKNEMLDKFMNENISWAIEGDFVNNLFKERMERADKIVIMKFNRIACLFKYLKNNKEIKKEEIKNILSNSRGKNYRSLYRKIMRAYSDKVVLLFNQAQVFMLRDLI